MAFALPVAAFLATRLAAAFLTTFLVRVGALFLAVVFLAADFEAVFFLDDFFRDGPFSASQARRPASNSRPRSKVRPSRLSPRRRVALVSPSVTYMPKRPSLTNKGLL